MVMRVSRYLPIALTRYLISNYLTSHYLTVSRLVVRPPQIAR
jgi:hypothetical protein